MAVSEAPSIDNGYGRWAVVERDSAVTTARFHVVYADQAPYGAVASFHRREDAEDHIHTLPVNTCGDKRHLHSCETPRGMSHTYHNCKCGRSWRDGDAEWPMEESDLCWFLDRRYAASGYREELESSI